MTRFTGPQLFDMAWLTVASIVVAFGIVILIAGLMAATR